MTVVWTLLSSRRTPRRYWTERIPAGDDTTVAAALRGLGAIGDRDNPRAHARGYGSIALCEGWDPEPFR